MIDDRYGAYPFALLALLVWLPLTAWLVWAARRSGRDWEGAAGFAVSVFTLLFIARVFQTSYLAWPLTGVAVAFLLAAGDGIGRGGVKAATTGGQDPRYPRRALPCQPFRTGVSAYTQARPAM